MTDTAPTRTHHHRARIHDRTTPPSHIRLGLVVGSTRPGRKARAVADWAWEVAGRHPSFAAGEAVLEMVDLAEVGLPLLDEPVPAVFGIYEKEYTRQWAATVGGFDAFVFVVPEYNHSMPAVVKNAIDFLFAEWSHKPVGFVGYGLAGGVRAIEHLRLVLLEVKALPTGSQVALSVFDDFTYEDPTDPVSPCAVTPRDHQAGALVDVLDDCLVLARAITPTRTAAPIG